MGQRTFDLLGCRVTIGDLNWQKCRVVRDAGTVYILARTVHYPEYEQTSTPNVVLLWSGVATLDYVEHNRWALNGVEPGTVRQTESDCDCGGKNPMSRWSP